MLEQSYLKSKGLLKEDVDVDKFKQYIENLSKNYKFPYHIINDNVNVCYTFVIQ
jgi:hypothetical protein